MIVALLGLMLIQGEVWVFSPTRATVGDTISIERILPALPGVVGRTRPLPASEVLEPLGAPELIVRGGEMTVRHRVALFEPGTHRIPMPAVELISPDGHVEMVVGDTASVRVASVIPDSLEQPQPRWSGGPIARSANRIEPIVYLLVVVVIVLAGWTVARRRTRPPVPQPTQVEELEQPSLTQWVAAGEGRAVASFVAQRIRTRIADSVPEATPWLSVRDCLALAQAKRPEWPIDEIEDLLMALERSRFAALVPDDAMELLDRTDVILERVAQMERAREGAAVGQAEEDVEAVAVVDDSGVAEDEDEVDG